MLKVNTPALFAFIVDATRPRCSTNLRVKVFGILGTVKRAARVRNLEECPIKADYGKSVDQAYEEATRYMMRSMVRLEHLSMVSDRRRDRLQDLPSWALIFRRKVASPLACPVTCERVC